MKTQPTGHGLGLLVVPIGQRVCFGRYDTRMARCDDTLFGVL